MNFTLRSLLVACLFSAGTAMASTYSNLVVFGDSLADSGNVALRTPARESVPLVGPIVPDAPYASGRFSNGKVWSEYFAEGLGLSVSPSLPGGNNYAFGGARVAGTSVTPSLGAQVSMYLDTASYTAAATTLYVLEAGGNDARDILTLFATGQSVAANVRIADYASGVASEVTRLANTAGADHFLVWNVTDIGLTPALQAMGPVSAGSASFVATAMNQALAASLAALPGNIKDGLTLFDAYAGLHSIVDNASSYGLSNFTDACAANTSCMANNGAGYFFWDGIHPTTAGHQAMASLALAAAVPEPETYAMFLAGLGLLGLMARRRSR